jgi:hypothetical protein
MREPITFSWCEKAFATRRKGSDRKPVFRDCFVTKDGDNFLITHKEFVSWQRVENPKQGGRHYEKITKDAPIAVITPADTLTMLYDGTPDMTVCNRLTVVMGHNVGLNKRDYGNYRTHVRVYNKSSWDDSSPYFCGMQFDVRNKRSVLLNPRPDIKLVVSNDSITAVKRETATIRKLVKAMARIGAFEALVEQAYHNRNSVKQLKSMDQINLVDPTAEDADALVVLGMRDTNWPSNYIYKDGRYTQLDDATRRKMFLDASIEKGLKLVREDYYKRNDGYMEIAA